MRLQTFALTLAVAGLVLPHAAGAHTQLLSSTPVANATVEAPTQIELRFSEAVIPATLKADIAMIGMPGMTDHPPMPITGFTTRLAKDNKSMALVLKTPLSTGTYRVTWVAAGADTHRMGSNFTFMVK